MEPGSNLAIGPPSGLFALLLGELSHPYTFSLKKLPLPSPHPQRGLKRQSKVAPKQLVVQAGAPKAEGGQAQPSRALPPGLPEGL